MAKPYSKPYSKGMLFNGKIYRYNGWWLTKRDAIKQADSMRRKHNAMARVVPAKHAGYEVWVRFN